MKTVVFITARFPHPLNKGDKLRAFNQLKTLGGMAHVHLVSLSEQAPSQDDLDAVLSAFAQRRLPRAKLVYDTSLTIGEWEMAQWNGQPHGDIGALMNTTYTTLMQNI